MTSPRARVFATQPSRGGFSGLVVNIAFIALVGLFLVGPPVEPTAHPAKLGALLLSQFHPYVLLFLALLIWRRWADGSDRFHQITAIRFLRTIHNGLVRSPHAVYLVTAGGALVMFAVSARRHLVFESRGDLAIYEHGLWNTVHGVFHRSSLFNDLSLFGNHFEPLQLALVPIYFVVPSALTLLAVQSVMIALGAVPLYWIARQRLVDAPHLWPVFPVAYLAFAPLRVANRFDYHPSAMVPALFLFALWFMLQQRWGLMVLFLGLAGLLKENLPAAGVTVGLYLAVVERKRTFGAAIALAWALWFYAGITWIIPAFNPWGYGFFGTNYTGLGNSISDLLTVPFVAPGRIVQSLLTRPGWKLNYLLGVFGPLGFLPFLSPAGLLLGLPFLAQSLLATARSQVSLLTHNSAEVIAFVFFAAVLGAGRLLAWMARARGASSAAPDCAAMVLAIVLWSTTFLFHQWSEVSSLRQYPDTPRVHALRSALHLIPDTAAVSASANVLPHLTHRHRLYAFPPAPQYWFPNSNGVSAREADFVVIDESHVKPSHRVEYEAVVTEAREKGYRPVFQRNRIHVWRRH